MIATVLVQANGAQPWYLCGYLCAAGILSALSTVWLGRLRAGGEEPRMGGSSVGEGTVGLSEEEAVGS